jgi:hypothetical protein
MTIDWRGRRRDSCLLRVQGSRLYANFEYKEVYPMPRLTVDPALYQQAIEDAAA